MSSTEEVEGSSAVFVFPDGSKYEGSWIWHTTEAEVTDAPAPVDDAPKAKGKGGKDAPPVEAAPVVEKPKVKVRHGQGTMISGDNIYEGEWKLDKMHGNGLFKFAGGSSYDGEWQDDMFHGKGKYTWASGAYYIGDFQRNKMHGEGAYYDEDGRKWTGKFYNGAGPGLHTL